MSINKQSKDIIEGLHDFKDKLEQGIPIEATKLTSYNTPDGPMHVREHTVTEPKNER